MAQSGDHCSTLEVLNFRTENLKEHRAYINGVHRFTRELSALSTAERSEEMAVRTEELKDLARKIRSVKREGVEAAREFRPRDARSVLGARER